MLLEKTDSEHMLTMPEIIANLELQGISAGRKAIYEDIEALKFFGVDIITEKGKYGGYYIASRDFELPELKLLADAVTSSRFLTEKKANSLLKKIEGLASVYEGRQIQRQVYVVKREKSDNEGIYINVDKIHRAIAEKKQIRFRYFDYNLQKRKQFREGERVCSPYALTWDSEKYYLVAFYEKRGMIANFRVDRMADIELLPDRRVEMPEDFSLSEYLKSTFSMFSGDVTEVKLRFDKSLVNPIIDRFGKDVRMIPDGPQHFTINLKVKAEPTFFSWLFQFGAKAQIISPASVKEKYADMLRESLDIAKN